MGWNISHLDLIPCNLWMFHQHCLFCKVQYICRKAMYVSFLIRSLGKLWYVQYYSVFLYKFDHFYKQYWHSIVSNTSIWIIGTYQCLWIMWWRTLTLKRLHYLHCKKAKNVAFGGFQDGFLHLHCHWHYKCTTHGLLQFFLKS